MKKIINKLCYFSVTAMLFITTIIATPTCIAWHYQPEVPKALRK
ncbi:cyclic lactone autoinducer peptide [Desulfallas thermosapovorans]|uniref:Cyclic lactone autoinducer peptide n=1 Tax=Desulfallas thermosapovorans DSM 6562 TaxID=1121431 RepID=A0A5S4ZRQ1_9FIRM|nr:cyclic lactone autoinducer peptide [Desulfallas thermosapovorans DSM 6562]